MLTVGIIPSFWLLMQPMGARPASRGVPNGSDSKRGKPAGRKAHRWRPKQRSEHTLAMSSGNTLRQDGVVLLAELVDTSQAVGATPARREKVDRLAAALRRLEPDEVPAGVAFLSGELRQRQIGVGWATLRDAPAGGAEAGGT